MKDLRISLPITSTGIVHRNAMAEMLDVILKAGTESNLYTVIGSDDRRRLVTLRKQVEGAGHTVYRIITRSNNAVNEYSAVCVFGTADHSSASYRTEVR